MARMKKLTRGELPNLLRHNNRTVKRKPDHIDPTRAHLNRRLSPDRQGREYAFFKQRMKEIDTGRERANRVVCVEWVVTAVKSLDPSEVNDFFDVVYAYLCQKYGGEQNVIACYQHGDEQGETPHIHLDVLPIVKKSDGTDRLNAKELLNDKKTKHLSNWHNELDATLVAAGFPPTQNGATKAFGRNRTVDELKRQPPGEYQREQEERQIKLNFKINKEKERGVEYEIIR